MRIYNLDEALIHEGQLREWAEQEEEEAREQYEFPEVEKGLPECIRKTLKHGNKRLQGRRLLLEHKNGRFGAWIARLRRMQTLSRLYPKSGHDLGDGYYDSAPLPSLLVVFKQPHPVAAGLEQERQPMTACSSER